MAETTETTTLSLADRVTAIVEADEVQLPPLPELATRLRDLLADEKRVDAKRVAELVQTDPAVAASLLRIANSAAFGGLHRVTELGPAVARLGLKQVGAIVTALLSKGHFQSDRPDKGGMLQTLWDHSVVCGSAARHLAHRMGSDGSEAFLAGLLHDVGCLLVLKAVDHLEESALEFEPTRAVIDELMDHLHTRLGHHTLSKWKLPEPICRVALHHENPPDEGEDLLLTFVQAADLISQKLGFDLRPDPDLVLVREPAVECLELGDVELASLMVDLEDEIEEVRRLF